MSVRLIKDGLGWGIALWLIGYLLGILLFAAVPAWAIGWIILPIGVAVALWVLVRKVSNVSFQHYFLTAVTWTLIAVVFDYLFLVKLFKPVDGYYKLDVYLYYALTFVLPLIVGLPKTKSTHARQS